MRVMHIVNNSLRKQPLYHGTDLRILRLSKEERNVFKEECLLAIDYMYQFIKPYEYKLSELKPILKDNEDPYLYQNLVQAISCNSSRLKSNSKYSYNYTYFTTQERTAASYSATSWKFGEIGQIAYRFYQAIEKIHPNNWNPTEDVLQSIDQLISFVNAKEQPVVVEFYDYDLNYLFTDSGTPICSDNFFNGKLIGNFYYAKEVTLDPDMAIPLDIFQRIKRML